MGKSIENQDFARRPEAENATEKDFLESLGEAEPRPFKDRIRISRKDREHWRRAERKSSKTAPTETRKAV